MFTPHFDHVLFTQIIYVHDLCDIWYKYFIIFVSLEYPCFTQMMGVLDLCEPWEQMSTKQVLTLLGVSKSI